MSALLALRGLRKRIGNRFLLDIDMLDLERGESYLLSGGNGAGKTTLLRVLAGLEPADCDSFMFDGIPMRLSAYPRILRQHIGFVHHHPLLFSTTVIANVAFGLRAAGMTAAEVSRRAAAAVDWAGIDALSETPPQSLSAGEKQRVALARVHALDPELYLLDEPTANLDEDGRKLVTGLIEAIARERRTLLIACHDRELLQLSGVKRLHLNAGRLTALSHVRDQPSAGQYQNPQH